MAQIKTLLLLGLCMMASAVVAQEPVTWQIGQVCTRVEFFTPSIVHVQRYPVGILPTQKSLVVIAKPESVKVEQKGNTLMSDALQVKVDARTGALSFSTRQGKTLLREKGVTFEPRMEGPDAGAYRVTETFILDKDEPIYGLGTIQDGRLNRRGCHKLMEQSNLEDFQNVVQSIKGWGLYWDNYSRTQFDDDAQGMRLSSEVGFTADYYLMYGGSADGVIAQMRDLSGQVPMFP